LPQPFEPTKPKNLAARYGEIDTINCGEIAEPAGQTACGDHGLLIARMPRWYDQDPMCIAAWRRQRCNERLLDRAATSGAFHLGWCGGQEHPAGVHRHQPIEALGFLHISSRNNDAHARPASAHAIDQRPELPSGQRIDAGGWFVQD